MTRTQTTAKPKRPASRTAPAPASSANGADRQIKIGEAARIIGVEAYVLRFWETQFPFLRPRHSRSKHRYYDEKSLDSLRLIRRLLHSEGYTIAGAKKHIRETGLDRLRGEIDGDSPKPAPPAAENHHHEHAGEGHRAAPPAPSPGRELSPSTQHQLAAIRDELKSLHKLLAS
jgi:DNA-binding transcriptional MerR regulator